MQQPWRWDWRIAWALAGAAVLLFSPALFGTFLNWDDGLYVTHNARVQDLTFAGLLRLWSPAVALRGEFIEFYPLRDTVYAVLWAIRPDDPFLFHAVQVVLHALNTVLVLAFLRALGLSRTGALGGAALFLAHPVHVEAIAWIAALKDPLSLALYLGAALAFFRSDESRVWYGASIALVVAGFLVKSPLVTWVPVIALADVWIRGRGWKRTMSSLAPHALVSVLFFALIIAVGAANGVIREPFGGTRLNAALLGAWCLLQYAGLLVAPLQQSTFYLLDVIHSPTDWRAWSAVVSIAAIALALWRGRGPYMPRVRFGTAMFVLTLLPVLHLVPIPVFMADRYLYLPSVGFAFLFATGVDHLAERRWVRPAAAVVVGLLALGGWLRIDAYRDSPSLWLDALDQPLGQRSVFLLQLYGNALMRESNEAGAVQVFERALAVAAQEGVTDDPAVRMSHVNLATILLENGRVDDADRHVVAAAAIDATDRSVRHLRARILAVRGRLDEALRAYDELLAGGVGSVEEEVDFAHALVLAGRGEDARAHVQRALRMSPASCAFIAAGPARAVLPGACAAR